MKISLYNRVYNIANKYNITQVTVHEIINSYINYCKERTLKGNVVQIYGLVTLIPDTVLSSYKTTLAYDCKILADKIGLPSNTVYHIIKEYLESIKTELQEGNNVEMRGLVSFHIAQKPSGENVVHSAISTTFRTDVFKYVVKYNTPVNSVRVHTHKMLKDNMKEGMING